MIIVAIILIPSFIAAFVLGYLALNGMIPGYEWLVIIPISTGIGVYMVKRGIYEWWVSRFPVGLTKFESAILSEHFPYYNRLGAEHKVEFEKRLNVFREQKKFQMQGAPKIPGDIQLLLSASAISITMGFPYQKEFFKKLATIIMYPKTFITPALRNQHHVYEVNTDKNFDCLIIAINMFVEGLKNPKEYYDSALLGFAKLFKNEFKLSDDSIPYENKDEFVAEILKIRGFMTEYIFKYTAINHYELFELCSELFFLKPSKLKEKFPKVYEFFIKTYQQDPLNYNTPDIQDLEENF